MFKRYCAYAIYLAIIVAFFFIGFVKADKTHYEHPQKEKYEKIWELHKKFDKNLNPVVKLKVVEE